MGEHANLWPSDLLTTPVETPIAVLKEQADQLGTLTHGRLTARVKSGTETFPSSLVRDWLPNGPVFRHSFEIVAKPIDFVYVLFDIYHGPDGFPAVLEFWGTDFVTAHSREALEMHLQQVFADNRTKRLIASIIAMVGGVPSSAAQLT